MNPWDQFTGVNAGYVYELYERFQRDPDSRWTRRRARAVRKLVAGDRRQPGAAALRSRARRTPTAAIAAFNLAESIRRFGHLAARLDPLGITDPIGDPSLHPQSHGLTSDTLARLPASSSAGPPPRARPTLSQAIERLRAIYCATAGHDYNHVFVPEERVWLRQAVETGQFRPPKRSDQRARSARSHHRGRDVRAVPASHVPRQDALLDRGAGHDDPDSRRDHHATPRPRVSST